MNNPDTRLPFHLSGLEQVYAVSVVFGERGSEKFSNIKDIKTDHETDWKLISIIITELIYFMLFTHRMTTINL
jgi:hypothetical protein